MVTNAIGSRQPFVIQFGYIFTEFWNVNIWDDKWLLPRVFRSQNLCRIFEHSESYTSSDRGLPKFCHRKEVIIEFFQPLGSLGYRQNETGSLSRMYLEHATQSKYCFISLNEFLEIVLFGFFSPDFSFYFLASYILKNVFISLVCLALPLAALHLC